MTVDWFEIGKWAIDGAAVVFVGITRWGMSQKEKAAAAEKKALVTQIESLEAANKDRNPVCAQHRSDLEGLKERMSKMEGFMEQVAGEFTRAMENMNKMTDRLTTISDRMLTKEDLQLILQVQGK